MELLFFFLEHKKKYTLNLIVVCEMYSKSCSFVLCIDRFFQLTIFILDCVYTLIAGIKDLPDSIKECKSLRSIDISVNPFERFPDAITYIVSLRELYLNDAYIEYLPANFGRLSALRTLELRENNMMTLPKSMSRLVNLQRLDIGNNDFTELVRARFSLRSYYHF